MFCDKCGTRIPPNASFCPSCGASLSGLDNAAQTPAAPPPSFQAPIQQIPNHLVGAILTTLFCCLPIGIVSLVYASGVNGKVAVGDLQGAQTASNNAQTWMWVAFGFGIVTWLAWLVFVLLPMAIGLVAAAVSEL